MAEEFALERDPATGRIVGKRGCAPRAGRPREADAEKLRALVREVLDEETVRQWQEALRRKLRKGNSFASAFVRDTLAGKPAVNANVSVSPQLQAFMDAWRAFDGASGKDEGQG